MQCTHADVDGMGSDKQSSGYIVCVREWFEPTASTFAKLPRSDQFPSVR